MLTYASFGPTDPTLQTYSYLPPLLKFVGMSFRKMETFIPRAERQSRRHEGRTLPCVSTVSLLTITMRLLNTVLCGYLHVDADVVVCMKQRQRHSGTD